jgi:hypothetical protein
VELARFTLDSTTKPIQNAREAAHPKDGELDLRFRSAIAMNVRRFVRVGIVSLGNNAADVAAGWRFFARACQQLSSYSLIIDNDLDLENDLTPYDLVCISGGGSFKLNAVQQKAFKDHLVAGKVLFCDALDKAAATSFNAVFEKAGRALSPLAADDDLLSAMFLFSKPPHGASDGQVLRDQQIIYSDSGYSHAWGGKLLSDHDTRADIRSVHEWGINIICYMLNRQR